MADVIDKVVKGEQIGNLNDLYTAYLYNWIDNIDQGLRHWPEFGLAFTKALFDAQSRRDLQNQEGAASGADTVDNILRGNKEDSVGLLDVLIEELDDPNGDGSTKDSFNFGSIEFDIDLQKIFSLSDIPINLGTEASNLGLGLDASATVDLSAILGFVDAIDENLPKFTFGIDFAEGITDDQRMYVKIDRAVIDVDVACIDDQKWHGYH